MEFESEIKVRDFQTSFCDADIHLFLDKLLHTQLTFSLSLQADEALKLCL